jgi:hypothetical protein
MGPQTAVLSITILFFSNPSLFLKKSVCIASGASSCGNDQLEGGV